VYTTTRKLGHDQESRLGCHELRDYPRRQAIADSSKHLTLALVPIEPREISPITEHLDDANPVHAFDLREIGGVSGPAPPNTREPGNATPTAGRALGINRRALVADIERRSQLAARPE
jgi:hypothetical protein